MSDIINYYRNSTILITGATGYIGKLLVEKILRSCVNINKIYLLVRDKNGLSADHRMSDYFTDEVFFRLKSKNYKNKVKIIHADLSKNDLDLKQEDKQLLLDNVNIIFHMGATISFNQKLRTAFDINVIGLMKLISLAQQMTKLKSFVHVSTIYSNCREKYIEEKIYDPETSYDDIVHILKEYTDDEIEKMLPKLLNSLPNTYTFTKQIAEKYLADHCSNLPVGIFRPAIVIPPAKEPIAGWCDNYNGTIGISAFIASGLIHAVRGRSDAFANTVPGDFVANAIIACGWEIGEQCKKLRIYNFVASQNRISYYEFTELTKLGLSHPLTNSIWYMSVIIIYNKWLYEICKFILHVIPAYIFDTILRIFLRKPYLVKTYNKIHVHINALSFFIMNDWEYEFNNVTELWDKMNGEDKNIFNFDMYTLNWNVYFTHYIKGIRMYLFKEPISTLETARTKCRRLYWLHTICKHLFMFLIVFLFYRLFKYILYC